MNPRELDEPLHPEGTIALEPRASGLRAELGPMLRLATPVVIAELGWMAMGLVDTMIVGRVSATAIGAVSVGSHLSFVVALFGMGIVLGLDPLVSQAYGAGRLGDAHRSLVQGIFLSLVLGIALMMLLWRMVDELPRFGIDATVLPEATAYLEVITWGVLPLLVFAALRRYLQGMNVVRPAMVVVLTANLINLIANWVLVFGNLGFPAMGAEGSAWATTIARYYMVVALAAHVLAHARRERTGLLEVAWRVEPRLAGRLVRLGLPAAVQVSLEGGIFAVATLLAASLDPVSLAAHQIALSMAAFSFMVPLGVSAAGAVRVGQALGRRDFDAARRSGWAALLLGGGFMSLSALVFVLLPEPIVRIFTDDVAVLAVGIGLLRIAAAFQLFDGVQVVATGILRGSGDTRTAMLTSLFSYWMVGLPVAALLCFSAGFGVYGLWGGLTAGLVLSAFALVSVWRRRSLTFATQ